MIRTAVVLMMEKRSFRTHSSLDSSKPGEHIAFNSRIVTYILVTNKSLPDQGKIKGAQNNLTFQNLRS